MILAQIDSQLPSIVVMSRVRPLETFHHFQHDRSEGKWRTSQPTCGETLRGKTSSAAIRLKSDEKIHVIGGEGRKDNSLGDTSDTCTYPHCQACAG